MAKRWSAVALRYQTASFFASGDSSPDRGTSTCDNYPREADHDRDRDEGRNVMVVPGPEDAGSSAMIVPSRVIPHRNCSSDAGSRHTVTCRSWRR